MIYDIDDNPLTSQPLGIRSGETKVLFIRVECRTGYFLRCDQVLGLTVSAKLASDANWTNVETTPIDLSPFAGTRQNFSIRLVADPVTAIEHRSFNVTVSL